MPRTTIDPVTRLNGGLRVEVDLAGGTVADALVSATTFRGLEAVMCGRDPRDAWLLASRICGSCTGIHALSSVRAVERALGIRVPTNARLIRNVIAAAALVRDHVLSFYLAQLPDWVDATAAVRADPAATAALAKQAPDWPTSTTAAMRTAQTRVAAAISGGGALPFATPWAGHPLYTLTAEQSLLLLAHALEALDWQRDLARVHAILGGKDPHPQTYLVGGMAIAPPWGGPASPANREHPEVPDRNAPNALSADGLTLLAGTLERAATFVERVFVPDVRLVVDASREWIGPGAADGGFLAWGDLPESDDRDPTTFLSAGRIVGGALDSPRPVDPQAVGESVAHAWYADDGGDDLRTPPTARTAPAFDGTLPLPALDAGARYSWARAPRYDGTPMETGPLARTLVALGNGRDEITNPLGGILEPLRLGTDALSGVAGRMLARAAEAQAVIRRADGWVWELRTNLSTGDVAVVDLEHWDPSTWPDAAEGWSVGEGPRGAVAHWVRIRDDVVDGYQVVDGSTWNLSPRDGNGRLGPLERALVGTPVSDAARPLELLRIVHSFNPCPACAVHAWTGRTGRPSQLVVRTERRR